MKRPSTLLVIRKLQIKTTIRYHLAPTKIAITVIFKRKITSVGGNVTWCNYCENSLVVPHKVKELPHNPAIALTSVHCTQDVLKNTFPHKNGNKNVHSITICNSRKEK